MRRRQAARLQLEARDAYFLLGETDEEMRISDGVVQQAAVTTSDAQSGAQVEPEKRTDEHKSTGKKMKLCPKCKAKPAYHFHVVNCKGA